jgi:Uma2 family endonuclease
MALAAKSLFISVQDYLEGEKMSEVRHEYLDGEVLAMSDESRRHNRIAFNTARQLDEHLEDSDCEIYFESGKLQIAPLNYFYYPNVVVTCEKADNDESMVTSPRLVIEVLSPSTSATDLREKAVAYRQRKSLREYLILEQNAMKALLWRREKRKQWSQWNRYEIAANEMLELSSIDFRVKLSALYRGVSLPSAVSSPPARKRPASKQ